MQAQTIQTEVKTLTIVVSGGEFATRTSPTGRVTYWFCGRSMTYAEARKFWEVKRPH